METRENTLSERERHLLQTLLNDTDESARRRARVLLDWSAGHTPKTIARELGLRPAHIHKLTRSFLQNRLDIFPPAALERALRGAQGAATIESLVANHPTDLKHTRHVTALALQLFDATASVHHAPPEWRHVLQAAAQLHALGSQTADEEDHARRAHDLILAYDIEGLTSQERDVVATLALFTSKKVKPDRDALFGTLGRETQHITLALAALLRVANALDSTKSQSTVITNITVDSIVDVAVSGARAAENAARANKKADLWNEALAPALIARAAAVSEAAVAASTTPLEPTTRLSDAARRIIAHQFDKLAQLEEPVRAGADDESVHDMRVASRRMHSAFRLFKPHLRRIKKLMPVMDKLRERLGAARNADVLLADLQTYREGVTEAERAALDAVVEHWREERRVQQEALVQLLDSAAYADWRKRMLNFVQTQDPHSAPRLADAAPALVWKQYGAVRAYETRLATAPPEELHALRIDIKRLRYTLEFFAEAFGGKPAALIEPLIALQDRLGTLQDAVVAGQALTDVLASQAQRAKQRGGTAPDFTAAAAYHAHLQARIADVRAHLPEAFEVILRPAYREELARAVAAL